MATVTNERVPSLNDETSTATLHVPKGVTATVLEITFLVVVSLSETTTYNCVPGSPNPLIVTLGALACEIVNWKFVGLKTETATVESLLRVTVGESCLFPTASVMVAVISNHSISQ